MKIALVTLFIFQIFAGCKSAVPAHNEGSLESNMVSPSPGVKLEKLPSGTELTSKKTIVIPGGSENFPLKYQNFWGQAPFVCTLGLNKELFTDLVVTRLLVKSVKMYPNEYLANREQIEGSATRITPEPNYQKNPTYVFIVTDGLGENPGNVTSMICERKNAEITMSNLACLFDIKVPVAGGMNAPLKCDLN